MSEYERIKNFYLGLSEEEQKILRQVIHDIEDKDILTQILEKLNTPI